MGHSTNYNLGKAHGEVIVNPPVRYSREPCFKDCWGDGLPNAHYHQVSGNDMLRKVDEEGN